MSASEVRVRFAPSPTGFPHVGNMRTALFNWLFARHTGGKFIVRIEDTDVDRIVPGAVEAILEGLRWLGLDWDEGPEVGGDYGPYFQSQRLHIYRPLALKLVEEGKAYFCYCSPERLEKLREEQRRRGGPPRYDRRCRDLSPEEREKFEAQGIKPVIRFKVPLEGEVSFYDLLRGEITFKCSLLDDFVILKSDGYPTYHLANVIDDHLMRITHVLRADEWIPSTPRHILLYRAFGWEPPKFAHLPMILGPDRSKLSKRHGAVSILEYRDMGYLPEALFNFLALLGWSLDDRTEIISKEDLIKHFSLERISKTGAIFNRDKLDWMNGVYIRKLPLEEFAEGIIPFLERGLPPEVPRPLDRDHVRRVARLIQERLRTLAEAPEYASFFFLKDIDYDPSLLTQKLDREKALWALEQVERRLSELEDFDPQTLEQALRSLASELGLRTGELFGVIRVAVTGRTAAPPLFDTLSVVGRERTLERIRKAQKLLRGS